MLKINGVTIATPKSFKVDIEDIDADTTTRMANGEMHRDRIAVKRKLICEWSPLKDSEISVILKAVQNVFFTVEYPDPMEGMLLTKTFYVGPRSMPMYWKSPEGEYLWQGLGMNFMEK